MGFGRSARGYRQKRGGGCLSALVWAGILLNLSFIVYSLSSGRGFALSSLLAPPVDNAGQAVRAFNNGDLNQAVTLAQAAVNSNPQDSAALMTLVRSLVYRSYVDFEHGEDLRVALEAATDGAERLPDDPNALAAYAFALQANGQPVTAAEVAEDALALDPVHTLARTALGLAYARVGSFEIGLRESQSALSSGGDAPELFDARRAVAISTADLGNYAEAGSLLDDLLRQHDRVIPLYFERALYARNVGDHERAEAALLRVLNLDAENIKAKLRLCELTSDIGEQETARQYCQQITTAAPNLPQGWYRLGRLHFLSGEFKQAQDTLNRCSTLQVLQDVPASERIFECWYLQGQAAEILGDCPALVAIYNQFQIMATEADIRETWTYPPEGPAICQ